MHAVVRIYSGKGGREVLDFIAANKPQIDHLLRSVPGFMNYVISPQGGFTVTISADEASGDALTAAARKYLREAAPHIAADPPQVMSGAVSWQLG